jgi:hypothetical protein
MVYECTNTTSNGYQDHNQQRFSVQAVVAFNLIKELSIKRSGADYTIDDVHRFTPKSLVEYLCKKDLVKYSLS